VATVAVFLRDRPAPLAIRCRRLAPESRIDGLSPAIARSTGRDRDFLGVDSRIETIQPRFPDEKVRRHAIPPFTPITWSLI
jgi:hypothetical protein